MATLCFVAASTLPGHQLHKLSLARHSTSPRVSHKSSHVTTICMGGDDSKSSGGFGAKPPPPRKPSEATNRRKAASDRYDKMAAAGMPEYSVWMRLKEGGTSSEEEEMPWLPVGCMSVPRSSQVSDALFDTEEDLMQGAVRLYPKLKDEPRENIQFGYQLREFDDEPIRIAERSSSTGLQAAFTNFFRKLQNPLNPAS